MGRHVSMRVIKLCQITERMDWFKPIQASEEMERIENLCDFCQKAVKHGLMIYDRKARRYKTDARWWAKLASHPYFKEPELPKEKLFRPEIDEVMDPIVKKVKAQSTVTSAIKNRTLLELCGARYRIRHAADKSRH